jgi:hypothetical protein
MRDAEHIEQCLLMQWAEVAAGRHPELRLLYAIPNGGHRLVSVARKLKREGVKAGVPDLCLPVARGQHHALYLELKAGKNRATPAQREWLDALWAQGNDTHVCAGWEAARDCITEYLALPRCVIVPLAESP